MSHSTCARSILIVVEEGPQDIAILTNMLESEFEVRVVISEEQTFELLASAARPDLILVDMMIPGISGFHLCNAVMTAISTQGLPIILISAKYDADIEVGALEAGVADLVPWPVSKEVLLARIRHCLKFANRLADTEALIRAQALDLAQARDEANCANRARSAFLSNVRHELMTPLHQMLGMASVVLQETSDIDVKNKLNVILKSGRHLHRLLNDLLEISRMEAQQIRLEIRDLDVHELLEDAAEELRIGAKGKGLEARFERGNDVPRFLKGDPKQLRQILRQLTSNAVKFTERGNISLRVQYLYTDSGANTLLIEIADQGVGISGDLQDKLFQLFNQGDNSLSRSYPGTGIGLAICKRLVDLMGGKLGYLTSDKGSTFWVTLPLALGKASIAVGDCSTFECNVKKVLEFGRNLQELLAAGDPSSRQLSFDSPELLSALLGDRLPRFDKAMKEFDFEAAEHSVDESVASIESRHAHSESAG